MLVFCLLFVIIVSIAVYIKWIFIRMIFYE